jgi:signal transduction histidine kinase
LKDKLKLIQQQIDRISRTVRTLVDFSKPITQKVEKIYLNQVVENVINIIKYDKRLKHQSIETEFDASIPLVKASFDQVLQVFINLCLNAADAMDGNKNGELLLKTWQENEIVYASVTDNGCGIDEDNQAHIFEPFFSTKEKGKGTGLGLWVSYNIIKGYGGDIKVNSTKDTGATFTISLPVSPANQG